MTVVHVTQEALIRLENAAEPYNPPQLVALAIADMLVPDEQRINQLKVDLPDAIHGVAAELAAANRMSIDQLIDHAIRIRY